MEKEQEQSEPCRYLPVSQVDGASYMVLAIPTTVGQLSGLLHHRLPASTILLVVFAK